MLAEVVHREQRIACEMFFIKWTRGLGFQCMRGVAASGLGPGLFIHTDRCINAQTQEGGQI